MSKYFDRFFFLCVSLISIFHFKYAKAFIKRCLLVIMIQHFRYVEIVLFGYVKMFYVSIPVYKPHPKVCGVEIGEKMCG